MPFTYEDKIIIKPYRLDKGLGRRQIINHFFDKPWSAGGLAKLLLKMDTTGNVEWKKGSGRILFSSVLADVFLRPPFLRSTSPVE